MNEGADADEWENEEKGELTKGGLLEEQSTVTMIVDISHSVCTNTRRLFSPKQNNF